MAEQIFYRCKSISNGSYTIETFHIKRTNCFLTKQEAIEDFDKAEKIALKKYEKIRNGMRKLKEEVGDFDYEYDYEVDDDSGLDIFIQIVFIINGYEFRYNQ